MDRLKRDMKNMKEDEMMERYEQKKFSKELEKQMKNEMK